MDGVVVASVATAVLTRELSINRGFGPVMASASVSLFFGIAYSALGYAELVDARLAETIPLAAMGSSFIGMSSKEALPSILLVAIAGLLFSFVFLFSSPVFAGLGGSLGIAACTSVVAVRGMMMLLRIAGLYKQ